MGRWNSRRADPGHPVLFVDARDIPVPLEPPRPRAAETLAPYAELLRAAEAEPLARVSDRHVGHRLVVGGERRPADALLGGDALLDDGTAVLPIRLSARAPRALREALAARLVLLRGVVREHDGGLALEPDDAVDLRTLARTTPTRRR